MTDTPQATQAGAGDAPVTIEPAEAHRATTYVPAWRRFRHRMAHEVLPKEMIEGAKDKPGDKTGA